MATTTPPENQPHNADKPDNGGTRLVSDVELLKVVVTREGQKVSAQWAIHPQIKHDLLANEWKEVSDIMAKVTTIVGSRFAKILSEIEPDRPGTA